MGLMWTKRFWQQTTERVIKTFAQAAIAMMTGEGLGLYNTDWGNVFSVAGLAAVISLFTSIASNPFTSTDTPDLTGFKL